MPTDPLLADLTEPQRQAVLHRDGPLLVLAGAGSGKTRVITRRAAMLADAVGPHHVLAITFTNKAADEMRQRIADLGVGRGMWVLTFHALCARLLRMYADRVGLQPNYTIFDQADRQSVVREAIEECGLSSDNWRPRSVEEIISRAKNDMQSPEEFAAEARDFTERTVARIFKRYDALLAERNAVDFDDLLVRTAGLLRSSADVREELEARFHYVLIDEYQDTNHAQYLIARGLTSIHRNICATGDPDQSIYGWRGADIRNILEFERDYPDATVVRLEQNFRSTQSILSAAGALIARNRRRKKKDIWTENEPGARVRFWNCADEHDEAVRIARDIVAYRNEGGSPGECAVFYRVSSLTRVLEDALRRAGLPYQIARGVEFYNRKEIKDLLSYLRVMVNPADEPACMRAINTPARGIGKTTVQRLVDFARQSGITLRAAMGQAEQIPALKSAAKKVKAFADLLDELCRLPPTPVRDVLEAVLQRSGLERALKADPDPEKAALGNVEELVSAAAEYDREDPAGSLPEWLAQVSLVNDQDAIDLAGGAVTLMTLHAAKGLEFPQVYIAGLEERLLPHERAMNDRKDGMEEERRLFFVGMTRAMKRLTLSRAAYRMLRGFSERTVISSFIHEVPRDELEWQDFTEASDRRGRGDAFEDDYSQDFDEHQWARGRLVRHKHYGIGRVVSFEMARGAPWVRVKFTAYGEKSFSLQYAELEVIEQ